MSVAAQQELVERIWARDATVWTGSGEEQWLGWLDEPKRMQERVGELRELAGEARSSFETFILLGMGGSSLAPQVVDDRGEEIAILGRDFGFGRLIRARAEGDFRSRRDLGRKIVRVRI